MKSISARLWASLAFLTFLSGSMALASGGMEGGGGKTVVCRNPDGSIRSAEILDLYEGRTVYGLPYQESPVEWKAQAEAIFRKAGVPDYSTSPPSGIYDWYENAIAHLVFLPEGTSLKPIDDSLEAIIPDSCSLEQTINYQNDRRILVNGSIWKALSETQKAALMIHEAAYRLLRGEGETDSRRARHLTAHLVSGHPIDTEEFPGNGYSLLCEGGEKKTFTAFYVLKLPPAPQDSTPRVRLQFANLGGRKLMSKAYVDLDSDLGIHEETGPNLIDLLKAPDHWVRIQEIALNSLFEPGDVFDLWFHDQDGKWVTQIIGTSAVDGSPIGPIDITCR